MKATTRRRRLLLLAAVWVLTAVGCLPAAEPGDSALVHLVVGALADPAGAGFVPAAGSGFAERSIVAVRVRVSGDGVETMVLDVPTSGELEIPVPPGPARRFEVEALGAEQGGGARVWGGATVADIGAGTVDVHVLLSPNPQSSTISGRVVTADGSPAAFARLSIVSDVPALAKPFLEQTRSGGALAGVVPGVSIAGLAVDADGPFGRTAGAFTVDVPQSALFSFRLRAVSLDGASRAEGAPTPGGELRLAAMTGRLEGTGELDVVVLAGDGSPVTAATVMVGVDGAFAGAVVGSGGRLRLAALDPATLRVVAWRGDVAGTEVTAATAVVRAGAATALTIQLPLQVPVDKRAPETTLTVAPSGVVAAKTASLVFSADEPAAFECSLNGAPFAPCTSPVGLTGLAEGTHTFRVRAVDVAGNVDATPAVATWTVDTVAPAVVLSLISPAAATISSTTISFTFAGDADLAVVECVLDGGPRQTCSRPTTTLAALTDGPHTIEFYGRDAAGNVQALPTTHTWTVDTVPPLVTILVPAPGTVTNVVPLVSGTAIDPSGVTAVVASAFDGAMYFDGFAFTSLVPLWIGASGTDTWSWNDLPTASPPADGTYDLNVRAWDTFGHMGSDLVSFQLDTTPPMCAPCMDVFVAGIFPYASSAAIQVYATSLTDPHGPIQARYTGDIADGFAGSWIAPGTPQPLTLTAGDGAKALFVEYKDALGNLTPLYQTVVTLDTVAPQVVGYVPVQAPGLYGIGAALSFDLEFDEPVTIVGGSTDIALGVGRLATYNTQTAPTRLRFSYTVQSGDVTSALDAVSQWAVSLNGDEIHDRAGLPADLQLPLPGGPGSLAVVAAWQIDGVAPILSVDSPSWGSWVSAAAAGSLGVLGSCSEDGTVWISGDLVNSTACSGGSWATSLDLSALPDGAVNLAFAITDAAGNSGAAPLQLTLDTIAPDIPSGVTAVAQPDGSVRVQWDALGDPDLATYYVGYGADSYLTGTNAFEGASPLSIAAGITTVVLTGLTLGQPVFVNVWAGDMAGNLSARGPDAVTTPYAAALPFARLDRIRPQVGNRVQGGFYWLEGAYLTAVSSPILQIRTQSVTAAAAVTLDVLSDTVARAWLPPLSPRMFGVQLTNSSGVTSTVLLLPVPTTTPAEFEPLPTTSATSYIRRWLPGKVSTDFDAESVVFACNNGSPTLFTVQAAGRISEETWRLPALSLDCQDAAWIDANDDGFMDLLIANGSGQDVLLLGDGVSWTDATSSWLPVDTGATTGVAVGDFDRDGLPDIVIARSGQPRIWFNRGGYFEDGVSGTDYPTVSGWAQGRPAVADFTGDGFLDILFSTTSTVVPMFWTGTPTGHLASDSSWVPTFIVKDHVAVEAADLDRDGDLDAVLATSGAQPYWLRNLGTQFEEVLSGLPVLATAADLAVGDVDGDGDEDVAFAANPPKLWRNDGSAQFAASVITNTSAMWTSVALFDLDEDRDLDVLLGAFGDSPPVHLRNSKALVVDESAKQAGAPSPRYAGVAVQVDGINPLERQMLIFGGYDGAATNALYALSLTDLVWSPVCDSGACSLALPTARMRAAGSWNDYLRTLYIFGEESVSPDDVLYGFRYDDLQWDTYAPSVRPLGRAAASLTWLSPDGFSAGLHYLFGGSTDGSASAATNEVWAFDPVGGVWSDQTPSCPRIGIDCPEPRLRHASTGLGDEFVVVYGGITAPTGLPTNDLWMFDTLLSSWNLISGHCVTGPPTCPPPMAGAVAVYVGSRNWIVVHGNDEGTAYPDVWAYDLNTSAWLELCTNSSCGQGLSAAGGGYAILDPVEAALLRFGGTFDGGISLTNQLWRVWLK